MIPSKRFRRPNWFRHKFALATLAAISASLTISAQPIPFSSAGTGQPAPTAEALTSGPPAAPSETKSPIARFFGTNLPDALANGKFDLNVRARFEYAEEEGAKAVKEPSYAPTIRTRLGYTTGELYGFQAGVQGQNTSVIGPEENYNAAGSDGKGYKPVIADPPVTDLDQAWLSYHYTNLFDIKGGRERIDQDNQRFVGDVDWRQNIQTFDAAQAQAEPIDHLDLSYAYVWDVHRVYGNVSGLPAANQDYRSDSHLINVDYSGWKYGRFVGYSYLLDLNNGAGANNSCATYGGYFAGAAPVSDMLSVDYRAEFAYQTDYGQSLLRYDATYWNVEAGATYQPFALGGGCEDLGSGGNNGAGGGRASFRTPLATGHPFNGWAEVFLTDPSAGLRDVYGYAQFTFPAQIPLRFVYHKFDSDYGDSGFGQEFDAVVTKNFGRHWQALVEYAYYKGGDAAPPSLTAAHVDLQRFWAQMSFIF